ncbi:AAA family ATPase, partial [bacterium]|nr:AAA family ATPase [bacterium]
HRYPYFNTDDCPTKIRNSTSLLLGTKGVDMRNGRHLGCSHSRDGRVACGKRHLSLAEGRRQMAEELVVAKTVQTAPIRTLAEGLKSMLVEMSLVFDAEGVRMIAMDNTRTVLTHMRLYASKFEHYEYKVKNLGDLLALADYFNCEFDDYKKSNINLLTIAKLAPHIYELNSLVGMEQVKEQVLSMVLFFLQSLDDVNHDMLHSVIYGNPGVGKTRLIYILANIFATLGITDGVKVTFVKRADLVGQYLGQTAVKTKKVLEEACGGVLVIDEAYSLGDTEQRDSFSRECIDTLNQYLSECRRDLICVIAGYKADLENRFFKTNAGLKRRFAFQYEIPDYNAKQLRTIFLQNVQRAGWSIED